MLLIINELKFFHCIEIVVEIFVKSYTWNFTFFTSHMNNMNTLCKYFVHPVPAPIPPFLFARLLNGAMYRAVGHFQFIQAPSWSNKHICVYSFNYLYYSWNIESWLLHFSFKRCQTTLYSVSILIIHVIACLLLLFDIIENKHFTEVLLLYKQ